MSILRAVHWVDLAVRRRVVRVIGVVAVVQLVFALAISIRAKYAERRRAANRAAMYPSRPFEAIELEHDGSNVCLFMRGDALLADVVAGIDAACSHVLFETFIWRDDTAGRAVRDALDRAAGRGVRVYVLWDWFLSERSIVEGYFAASVHAYPFKPIPRGVGAVRPSNVLRDHRKIIVVDDRAAWIGGYNIGDDYLEWRDTHLRLEGPPVRELANTFVDFWNQHVPSSAPRLDPIPGRPWDPHVLVHRNDPSLAIFPIRGMFIEAIDRSAERVWLTTAYFVPDRAFRAGLMDAARRGVDVRVLLPARSNHPLTDTLAHGMFEELLTAGVRVFLYRDFMLHAKTAVIDREWSTIGTANLDRWSMLGNYEVNVEVRSARLAEQLSAMFELDLEQADEVRLASWRKRPISWRASERVLRSLAPLM